MESPAIRAGQELSLVQVGFPRVFERHTCIARAGKHSELAMNAGLRLSRENSLFFAGFVMTD
jgi:hypothetical protein